MGRTMPVRVPPALERCLSGQEHPLLLPGNCFQSTHDKELTTACNSNSSTLSWPLLVSAFMSICLPLPHTHTDKFCKNVIKLQKKKNSKNMF